jgi:hypothetical protein
MQLPPHLVVAEEPLVDLAYTFNFRRQDVVKLNPGRAEVRIAQSRTTLVFGRGNLEDRAARLAPHAWRRRSIKLLTIWRRGGELRLGEKRAGQTQNLVCLTQFFDLALE